MREDYQTLTNLSGTYCISHNKYNSIFTNYYFETLDLNTVYIRELEEFTKTNLYFSIVILILLNIYFFDKRESNFVFKHNLLSPIDRWFTRSPHNDVIRKTSAKKRIIGILSWICPGADEFI